MGAPSRIVVTGDILRPSVAGLRPTQHENILWLSQLLRAPLSMATGLPVETVHWDHRWTYISRLDSTTVAAIYQAMWLRADIQHWPVLYGAETLPAAVEAMLLPLFADSLVVGFELPPYLTHFLRRHGIEFVDCSLSPVRFMDDLLFEIGTSSEAASMAVRPHGIPEDLIMLQAGILSSNVAKANPRPPRPNTLLVLMQTCFDKVLIEDGRFVTLLDHMEALVDLAAGFDNILIKSHPLEPQPEVMTALMARLTQSQETKDNFYRLVSHRNLAGVTALSSSGVLEAKYFGKTGHYLMPGFDPRRLTAGHFGATIGDALIVPDFWREVMAAFDCPVTAHDGLRLPSKPNRFRQQLRSAWGYNELDTDIPVSWAQPAAT